jgi:hypothetical protein
MFKVGAHVDMFKDGMLISTTRPCQECGQPLVGVVVTDKHGKHQRHLQCPKKKEVTLAR